MKSIDDYFSLRNTWLDELTGHPEALAGVPAHRREQTLRTAHAAMPAFLEAVAPYADLPACGGSAVSSRVAWCILDAAVASGSTDERVLIDHAMWLVLLFAVDDIYDSNPGDLPEEEITAFAETCVLLTSHSEAPPVPAVKLTHPQLTGALAMWGDSCRRLRAYRAFHHHHALLSEGVRLGLDAYATERCWRGDPAGWPTLDAYIDRARRSTYGPLFMSIWLILLDHNRGTNEHRAALDTVTYRYGLSIRLCNDLRSTERDDIDGTPNAVSILQHTTGVSRVEAAREVLRWAHETVDQLREAVAELPPSLQPAGHTMLRETLFIQHFYLAREMHNFTLPPA